MEASIGSVGNPLLEEAQRARAMAPPEKFLAGANLFECACEITRAGIRADFPELDDAGVERILRERLHRARCIEGRP